MKLVWCAFTGALMLLSVLVTHQQRMAAEDPPGVITRWWDGTMQSVDRTFPDGKPYLHTEYGEDGNTILVHKEWSRQGALVHQQLRLKDGKLEEKRWDYTGKTLHEYTLWLGDGSSFTIQQLYHANGVLASEVTKTEDGLLTNREVSWDRLGRLIGEYHIRSNASHERKSYDEGRLVSKRTDFGSGDWEEITYWPNGNPRFRVYYTKLTGKLTEESFNQDGTLSLQGPNQLRGD